MSKSFSPGDFKKHLIVQQGGLVNRVVMHSYRVDDCCSLGSVRASCVVHVLRHGVERLSGLARQTPIVFVAQLFPHSDSFARKLELLEMRQAVGHVRLGRALRAHHHHVPDAPSAALQVVLDPGEEVGGVRAVLLRVALQHTWSRRSAGISREQMPDPLHEALPTSIRIAVADRAHVARRDENDNEIRLKRNPQKLFEIKLYMSCIQEMFVLVLCSSYMYMYRRNILFSPN